MTEGLLRVVLVAYAGFLGMSLVIGPVMAFAAVRRGAREKSADPGAVLLGMACLCSLIVLEAGSGAWRLWIHRLPRLPTSFAPSPADEFRIVVLGGSSALGEPYRPGPIAEPPWISVGKIVAWRLGEAMPARRIELDVLAWLGDSLEDQHRKLAKLDRRPQMVIIYAGHNEFTGAMKKSGKAGSMKIQAMD